MATKQRTTFFCQNCGSQSPKWLGRCPSCGEWNTFVEEVQQKENERGNPAGAFVKTNGKPVPLHLVDAINMPRVDTLDGELNRVLGGGIVPGSVILLGGEPGIGKSTLLLQVLLQLPKLKVLYISGEESEQQISLRAERIGFTSERLYLLTETQTQNIFKQIEILHPDLVVVDSIQTLQSAFVESTAGSVSQVRECAAELIKYAKMSQVPVIMVGHITKDGMLAGPKVLEHMVDAVLQFEGDRHNTYRILRTIKNRFGSTAEIGIYEMMGNGLRPVSNPSEILISQNTEGLSGVAIAATMEGNRPLLVEIQSLVSPATYGTPQRTATGFDNKRLAMLLAVLEKRGGYKLSVSDVFLNVAGGLRIEDPAVDLAVCASIISSYEEIPILPGFCFAAEVGLGGEIRTVPKLDARVNEAGKLGFKHLVASKVGEKAVNQAQSSINPLLINKLSQLIDLIDSFAN